MSLRASSHPGSPNSPSCSALAWYSCWPGLSPWGESWKRTRVARTAALTRYRYATQPTVSLEWISNLGGIFALRKPWQCGLSPASDENLRYLSPATSGLSAPRWYVNKAPPDSLAHCHASVVWWAATGNNIPCTRWGIKTPNCWANAQFMSM